MNNIYKFEHKHTHTRTHAHTHKNKPQERPSIQLWQASRTTRAVPVAGQPLLEASEHDHELV